MDVLLLASDGVGNKAGKGKATVVCGTLCNILNAFAFTCDGPELFTTMLLPFSSMLKLELVCV